MANRSGTYIATVQGTRMEKTLPIKKFKDQILSSVSSSQVTIIVAETGAGKSTQVPQYLMAAGYDVIITQPRRIAARTVAERVAEEVGCEFGGLVGYRVAGEEACSRDTKCLFATDGLVLVRELLKKNRHSQNRVLVLDEVHEWNLNLEVLVAWVKLQMQNDPNFKVVLMSATIEAEKLSLYFSGAQVINVPGRLYNVETRSKGFSIENDVAALVAEGRNVLVFLPGKAQIAELVSDLERVGLPAEIIPLHGELGVSEQARAFKHYSIPKVVIATNIAQTSVTIDDIDAVVDSGYERRKELVGSVEGLYLRPISLADSAQRKGRAGRTKPGIYISHTEEENREAFPVAEINRIHLDQAVLRFAMIGVDMEELDLFHKPGIGKIRAAKKTLQNLGALDQNNRVTDMGRKISILPVSVKCGRMVIEAEKRGCVGEVVLAAAIIEAGPINLRKDEYGKCNSWRMYVKGETQSDVLAQMHLYIAAEGKSYLEQKSMGVHTKAMQRVAHTRRQLTEAVGRVVDWSHGATYEEIQKCICVGMVDHVYMREIFGYRNGDATVRSLGEHSVLGSVRMIVGIPFDLEIKSNYGLRTINLVSMATEIQPEWLVELAPHLVERIPDSKYGQEIVELYFSGVRIGQEARSA